MITDPEFKTAWLVIYQSLIAMHHHPGQKAGHTAPQLAQQTDTYMMEFIRRFEQRHEPIQAYDPTHGGLKDHF